MGELNPDAQSIVDKLPGALEELRVADAELAAKGIDATAASQRLTELESSHETEVSGLSMEYSSSVYETYRRELREVMRHVFAGEEDNLIGVPPLEDCQRIAELDAVIVGAAGQPVVVMKPGKTWIDIGRLQGPDDGLSDRHRGLQVDYNSGSGKSSIVLPVRDTTTIDLKTGKEPSWEDRHEDEDLQGRDRLRMGMHPQPVKPSIDPLTTRVLPAAEAETSGSEPQTHILIGYTYLQHTLNRIYGFDFEALKGSEDMEDYTSFQAATQIQERLANVGIEFDVDYINGCLAYRIDRLERAIANAGPLQGLSAPYQESVLEGMKQKQAALIEAGWITR